MIKKMLIDLWYFVVILIVFIICYGVASQVVMYPHQQLGQAVRGVLDNPYWQLYGELFLDHILGNNEDMMNETTHMKLCDQPGQRPCQTGYGKRIVPVYLAVYMLFANILLLNLLIAIFNNTYQKVSPILSNRKMFGRVCIGTRY